MTSQIFRIVFEDPEVLVIEKLSPFASQRGDASTKEGLSEFIARSKGIPIYPIHRLDREVLGLMVFAKTKKAAEHLTSQFRDRRVKKTYQAQVWGRVHDDEGNLVHYLKKNPKTNYVTVFSRPTPDAKRAELDFKVLERSREQTLLEIDLKTGRTHQIRVQLAKMGHPIVGDTKYASSRASAKGKIDRDLPLSPGEIRLRSIYLGVFHPRTNEFLEWRLEKSL